jgi:serine/threonine protein kinase
LKLADFGLSKQFQKDGFEPKKIGSRGYMAPEILENKPFFGVPVDVFALGVLLYSLRAKELPFGQAKLNDCWYRLIGNLEYQQFWMYHERKNGIKFSDELK